LREYLDLVQTETGDWRRLLNEELYNLYYSPNIIRMIKSRRMSWAGHVACGSNEFKPLNHNINMPYGEDLCLGFIKCC
jgi:hypothetical protein